MSHIPQPKPVQLDYFDPNIVVGIVEESESMESAEKEGRKVTKKFPCIYNNISHCLHARKLKDVQNLLIINPVREMAIR